MAIPVMNFLISTGGSLAQAVLDVFSKPPCNKNFDEQIIRHDPEDNVFEEFDSSQGSWKEKRGSLWRAFVRSLWISLQIAFLSAFCVGPVAIILTLTDIVIKSKLQCEPSKKLYASYEAVKVFISCSWYPLLLLTVFRFQFLKRANLFGISLLGALLDVVIRLFLALFDAYEHPWKGYSGNVLFLVVLLVNSYNIGRKFSPQDRYQATKVAFKFTAQFIMTAPVLFLALYFIFPAFLNHQDILPRLICLGLAMLATFPLKAISRYCALSLVNINHPGNSFILVSAVYGGSIILFRIMQAEVEGFPTFIALSLVHGGFQLVEVLMIKVEEIFVRKVRQHCSKRRDNSVEHGDGRAEEASLAEQRERAHEQLQRFLADTIIQGMLFEMTALLISVSIIELYGIVNVISVEETSIMAKELVKRVYVGVFIEFVFNVCCVLILTRYMNIPILRVWKVRWKSHMTVFIFTTVASVLYHR